MWSKKSNSMIFYGDFFKHSREAYSTVLIFIKSVRTALKIDSGVWEASNADVLKRFLQVCQRTFIQEKI